MASTGGWVIVYFPSRDLSSKQAETDEKGVDMPENDYTFDPKADSAAVEAYLGRVESLNAAAAVVGILSHASFKASQEYKIDVSTLRDLPYLKNEIVEGMSSTGTLGVLIGRYTSFEPPISDCVPGWIGLLVEGYGNSREDALRRWVKLARQKIESRSGLVCTPYNPTGASETLEALPAKINFNYYISVMKGIAEILKSNPTNKFYEGSELFGSNLKFIRKEIKFFSGRGLNAVL